MSGPVIRRTATSEDDLGGSTRGFRSDIVESDGSDDGAWRADDGSLDATARIVDAGADSDDERVVEAALRPKRLAEFPGQTRVRDQLSLVLEAARRRGSVPDHILLSGPPGLGKTTLALIVAAELERPIRITSGPAIQHAGDLAAVLSSLDEGEVLFLDEIHRMSRSAEEMLYLAMEDFRVDVIVGKGPGATAIPLELPPFTVVGATTRSGLLPAPLRDRFGFTGHLDYYDAADLTTILRRSAGLLDVDADESGISEIAGRSRGTPRIANRLLRRVRDWAQVHGSGHVDLEAAHEALSLFDVDDAGLDRLDRAVLDALCRRFGGGPVGLSTLAIAVGEESDTVETVAEPYLVREGFMVRTPRGRAASPKAWSHLGLTPPRDVATQDVLPLTDGPGRLGG
ncbi:Holliday junction ATP-dependent DNA helicase RuvB [Knoellia flava]|uniref:Holliday junction branch migration complex subunit RuvB n=1 Tax=Knoellia flava TaxID=913969 RepID=A0A8H9FQ47_9MICO|nr:Holliday junction ATP-dependent DNA helicase RuvB [Knoellia flava]